MVVGWCHSLIAEHWRLKPEALGSIPGSTTFLSFPLPFQRSSDSNSLDNLFRSSDLGEPHLSGSQCCDDAQDSFVINSVQCRTFPLQAQVTTQPPLVPPQHHPHHPVLPPVGSQLPLTAISYLLPFLQQQCYLW